jgi:Fibrobacter succinogenes major domain (Fib_succ_major).
MIKAKNKTILSCVIALSLFTACNSNSDLVPVISTGAITNVTQSSANGSGKLISNGSSAVTERGICWSNLPNPTIKGNYSIDSLGTTSFVCPIMLYSPSTTYYVRAYATNSSGTGYGENIQLTTPADSTMPNPLLNPALTYGSMTDIDGNVYKTITIGTQTWMAENLRVTKYRNGDIISNETDNTKWASLKTGSQCTFNNGSEKNSIAKFGRLYNFYAVADARNIAPQGWHVASDAEWATLTNYINQHPGTSVSGAQALGAVSDWNESSVPGTVGCPDPDTYTSLNNSSGFCGLPIGIRGDYGVCDYVTKYAAWWTANANDTNSAWFRSLSYYSKEMSKNFYNKSYGLSVRCIKD